MHRRINEIPRGIKYAEWKWLDKSIPGDKILAHRIAEAEDQIRQYDPQLERSKWQWFDGQRDSVILWVDTTDPEHPQKFAATLLADRFSESRVELDTGHTYLFCGVERVEGGHPSELTEASLEAICSVISADQRRLRAEPAAVLA